MARSIRGSARPWALALALAAFAAPAGASASTTCVHTTAPNGWTFVLRNLKPKPGRSGAISGYAVIDGGGSFEAISGGFAAGSTHLGLGITHYLASVSIGGGGSAGWQTSFHQILLPLDGAAGSDYGWTGYGSGANTGFSGAAQIVSCDGVPKVPKTP